MSAMVTAGRSVGCAAYNKAAHNQPMDPPSSRAGCAAAQPAQPAQPIPTGLRHERRNAGENRKHAMKMIPHSKPVRRVL